MQNKNKKDRKSNAKNHYSINIIKGEGYTCVGIVSSGLQYSSNGKNEPRGEVFKGFKDRRRKRGQTLIKLGIWESGQNLKPQKKLE